MIVAVVVLAVAVVADAVVAIVAVAVGCCRRFIAIAICCDLEQSPVKQP